MNLVDLRRAPFALDQQKVDWVETTLAGLSLDERIGQLFCLIGHSPDLAAVEQNLRIAEPGGYMFRPAPAAQVREVHAHLQESARVPLLLAANLERGGNGIALEGTQIGTPMQVAATGDAEIAYRLGLASGREARAVGCNWSFAPIVDVDLNPQNPITNTRTFGSDPGVVLRFSKAFVAGLHDAGIAGTAKHWPGDGVDGRDQHLLTSVNTLSVKEWDASFGRIYASLIEAGVEAVMSAHIMLPAYSRELRPAIDDSEILPASLAPELNIDLLRGRLGFNGLIVSDATVMAGFTAAKARSQAVPGAIAAGCDMFLFCLDFEEDLALMRDGVDRGVISMSRLEDAVRRILALKASLGLDTPDKASIVPSTASLDLIGTEEHQTWAKDCADRSITLVKNSEGLIPLDPSRHHRLLVYVLGDDGGYRDADTAGAAEYFIDLLGQNGFEVTRHVFEPGSVQVLERPVSELAATCDAALYFSNLSTHSNQTTVRITWEPPMGSNAPRFPHEIPTIFVSVANPYHLQDVPHIKTFINGYTATPTVIESLVEKLLGRSQFKGESPIDPYCGLWDARR